VIIMSDLPLKTSTSVTSMAEHRAPEFVWRHFFHRFAANPPAIFFEHYLEARRMADSAVKRLGIA
jgi:hypothetical protein